MTGVEYPRPMTKVTISYQPFLYTSEAVQGFADLGGQWFLGNQIFAVTLPVVHPPFLLCRQKKQKLLHWGVDQYPK